MAVNREISMTLAKTLITRLNRETASALNTAAGLAQSRAHYEVQTEHLLARLVEIPDGDFSCIIKQFALDKTRLMAEISRQVEKSASGNMDRPSLGVQLIDLLSDAWNIASLEFGVAQIRSGVVLLAVLTSDRTATLARELRELGKIRIDDFRKKFDGIIALSRETAAAATAAAPGTPGAAAGAPSPSGGKTPNLDQFTVNLTERARKGQLDPVLGRDHEIRQVVDILMRRRQNNPILTGEAGVGKTAVVEGFAIRIANGDVPPPLRNVDVHTLDLALLQAGAGIKGEFENRLKGLIEEVKSSAKAIILFIDEAHTMIGAGGQAGQNDAANLLKPALARGELRTIAATTWSEYKKYFEKDPALARRFQVVKVEEPTEDVCQVMLRGVVTSLEKHHRLRILDEAVSSTVKLSHRYLAGRQLPDKAVSVLDTACARLALGQNSTPAAIEDARRQLDDLGVQKRVLEREAAVGVDHSERLATIAEKTAEAQERLNTLTARFEKEADLVKRIREMRTALEEKAQPPQAQAAAAAPASAAPAPAAGPVAVADPASNGSAAPEITKEKLGEVEAELAALQGDEPLMRVCVDTQVVSEVIGNWTGIPVGKMVKDEVSAVLNSHEYLGKRVVGQMHALNAIGQRIVTSRAGMDDPNKPVGVFMLVGPSGVGKTETALALSDLLYGGEHHLITINMSEFQEPHTVSTLKGSPPGYVGYGEGGVLTEAVRRRPYSVVLLDEVEKAHPDVLELFYQVFDKGKMEDGEGREIDFKNTIIILTTNACTDTMTKLCADPETMPTAEAIVTAMKPELNKIFKPAFLGRMLIIPFYPIRDEALRQIIVLKLAKVQKRLQENHRIELSFDDSLISAIAARCTEVESGARNVDNILTNTLLPEISRQLLGAIAGGQKPNSIRVSIGADGQFTYSLAAVSDESLIRTAAAAD